jgi:hypothetical protein
VGTVNKVPTFGISTDGLLKVRVMLDVPEVMLPASVPIIETEIGDVLPAAKGAVSVICNVKVVPEGIVRLVLLLTPERLKAPKAGLTPDAVMSVEDCGVKVSDTPPPRDKDVGEVDTVPVNDPAVE